LNRVLRVLLGILAGEVSFDVSERVFPWSSIGRLGLPMAYFMWYVTPAVLGYATYASFGPSAVAVQLARAPLDREAAAKYWGVDAKEIAPSGLPFQSAKLHIVKPQTPEQRFLQGAKVPRGKEGAS
jgi:hypothetical protein